MMEALKMEREMTHWNDDRPDEMNERMKEGFAEVDQRFDKVDERFVRVEREMKEGFARADQRMEAGFERINDRLDRLYQVFIVASVGASVTLIANGIWG